MNTSIESTLFWLLLTIMSLVSVLIAIEFQRRTKKWHLDRWADYAKGFFSALALVFGVFFALSL